MPYCLLCKLAPESIEHSLFECEWTKRVWFGMNLDIRWEETSFVSVAQRSSRILELIKDAQGRLEVLGKIVTVG